MKNIYVVLGAADGAAIVRVLAAAGVDLSNSFALTNEKVWEDGDIYKINRRLLALMGEPWMSARLIDASKQSGTHLDALQAEIIELLKVRMTQTEHLGFKDPRTAKTLFFWQRIFAQANLNDNYLIALSDPLSSALSYSRLSGERLETCLLFWLMDTVAAIEGTHNKRRILFHNSLQQSETQNINHQAELLAHPAMTVVPLCATIHTLLARVLRDDITFDSAEFKSAWRAIMLDFNHHYPLYCYADTVFQRTRLLNKKIHKIKRSLPWALGVPFRMLESMVRSMRSSSREREVKL